MTTTLDEKMEILGRLYLWRSAVDDTLMVLRIAKRARKAAEQENITTEHATYMAALQLAVKSTGGAISSRDLALFEASYPSRFFPTVLECTAIARNHQMLAVIIFGQIFNRGDAADSRVADNLGPLMEPYRVHIKQQMFRDGIDKNEYESFVLAVKRYRNEMVAHADGSASEMTHGTPLSSHRMISGDLEKVDFELMQRVCQIMRDHIHKMWQPLLDGSPPN